MTKPLPADVILIRIKRIVRELYDEKLQMSEVPADACGLIIFC